MYTAYTIDTDERELISGLRHNSQKAFNCTYQIYAKKLYAYCLQYTKISEDAEEIVQDVFVKLWTNRNNIKQEDSLQALLFIMSKHRLINAYRSRINSPVYEDYVNYEEKLSVGNGYSSLEYEDFVHYLQKELNKLPSTQKKVIIMSKIQQLSNKEIADELSLSEQTVKNQLSLGLKVLRESLLKAFPLLWLLFFVK